VNNDNSDLFKSFVLKGTASGHKLTCLLKMVGSRVTRYMHYANALCALPSILRYYLPHKDRPALKIINLAKEMRDSGVFAMLHTTGLLNSLST